MRTPEQDAELVSDYWDPFGESDELVSALIAAGVDRGDAVKWVAYRGDVAIRIQIALALGLDPRIVLKPEGAA